MGGFDPQSSMLFTMITRLSAASACPWCSVHCGHPLLFYSRAPARQLRTSLEPRPRQQSFATHLPDDSIVRNHGSIRNIRNRHSHSRSGGNTLPWPASKNPTPYEIFDQAREAPYQKTQFYHLVKLYHPDRHHHVARLDHAHNHDHDHGHGLSTATMLERYRLVVAANDILSDPAKRRAYDLYGAGWAGQANMRASHRGVDQSWRSRPGSAANNATWEDWERWHNERNGNSRGGKQELQFMSNGGFAVIIIFFVILGGIAQASRAGSTSLTMLETQHQEHEMIGRNLISQQTGHARLSRKDRVGSFLERREGWYDLPPSPSLPPPRRSDDSRGGT